MWKNHIVLALTEKENKNKQLEIQTTMLPTPPQVPRSLSPMLQLDPVIAISMVPVPF